MKLLICTQTMDQNDPILGFFCRWVEEFAKDCESVIVICLKEGAHSLPGNVRVLSLGKEAGSSRLKYVSRFYSYIFRERDNYDAVFVHMNQVYVLLGALLWRAWHKKIGLWYVHKSVTLGLRVSVFLVNQIFTTSAESFRIATPKRILLGHGIDTDIFTVRAHQESDVLRVITTGRITPSKNIRAMIESIGIVRDRGIKILFSIVGAGAAASDAEYETGLHRLVDEKGLEECVRFEGAISQDAIPIRYQTADVFLNLSMTGSVDKAVLEALLCGMPVVSSNPAFRSLLEPYGLFIEGTDPDLLADAVLHAKGMDIRPLVEKVRSENALSRLVPAILQSFAS